MFLALCLPMPRPLSKPKCLPIQPTVGAKEALSSASIFQGILVCKNCLFSIESFNFILLQIYKSRQKAYEIFANLG